MNSIIKVIILKRNHTRLVEESARETILESHSLHFLELQIRGIPYIRAQPDIHQIQSPVHFCQRQRSCIDRLPANGTGRRNSVSITPQISGICG